MLMKERTNYHATAFMEEINGLYERLERIIQKFRECKLSYRNFFEDLDPRGQNSLRNIFKAATKNGMGEFKDQLENKISKDGIDHFAQALFPEAREEIMELILLDKEEELEKYRKETKQFLTHYANLYTSFCDLMQIYYDREKFEKALSTLSSDQQQLAREKSQGKTNSHDTHSKEWSQIVKLLSRELDLSKNKVVSLVHYHYDIAGVTI